MSGKEEMIKNSWSKNGLQTSKLVFQGSLWSKQTARVGEQAVFDAVIGTRRSSLEFRLTKNSLYSSTVCSPKSRVVNSN